MEHLFKYHGTVSSISFSSKGCGAADLILAGSAPYILYVDDAFYCTSESRNAADDENSALK